MQNQNVTHHARQLESELGGEDSSSIVDSRVSRANMSIYGQNLMPHQRVVPITQVVILVKRNRSNHKHILLRPLASQTFAMSFASINGTTDLDVSSLAQNRALLPRLPEAARHGYHFIAKVQETQQTNYRVSEEGKAEEMKIKYGRKE
ncbi:hypothetical protein OIU76_003347 [Salix suchowensis]|nr:hypothetical protein OIU76_003347 [Salix suchowensis]